MKKSANSRPDFPETDIRCHRERRKTGLTNEKKSKQHGKVRKSHFFEISPTFVFPLYEFDFFAYLGDLPFVYTSSSILRGAKDTMISEVIPVQFIEDHS